MPDRSEGDINLGAARDAWRWAHVSAASRTSLAEDEALFFRQALSTPCLEVVERAEGSLLHTPGGRTLLDFHGNAVHTIGHGHKRVVAAIEAAMATLPFSPRRFTNCHAIELARRLVALAPMQPAKLLLAPGGASAIGMALKLARAVTGRHKTISMWESFHGASLDAISVGGEAIFRRDAGPLLPGAEHVPPPSLAGRFFGEDGRAHERLADYIDYCLAVQGDVAAVVAEPMRWTTLEPPAEGFWARVRASCDRHGAMLIFDEIPSGFGRTGTMFACEQFGAVPDMLVLGKALGGGVFPLAALLARASFDVAAAAALGHFTHEKSSVGCAAGVALLDVIEAEGLVARSARLGASFLTALLARLGALFPPGAIRGLGMNWAIETGDAGFAEAVLYRCLAGGLSFKLGGGSVITLVPPLTIEEGQLDQALAILARAIEEEKGATAA